MGICRTLSDIRGWDVEISSKSVLPVTDSLPDDDLAENELIYAGRLEISEVDSADVISFAFDGEVVR